MKLLRTIRLDPSDQHVFTKAADPGEWAVSGAFAFWERPVEALIGKERAAFRSGLLGISSLGWSTLAVVTELTAQERAGAVEELAERLLAFFGAPDMEMAREAAEQEIAYSETLAEPHVGTLIAVHRNVEAGEIRERFRTLLPGVDDKHARVFSFVMEEGDVPEERVDLMNLKRESGL